MNRLFKVVFCFSFITVAGWADDPTPPATPTKPWKNAAEFSVVSANGNSKTNTMSGKNIFNYNWTRTGLELIFGGLGSSSKDDVTAEQYFGSEKMTWNFTTAFYAYEKFGWDKNRFAGIENRYDASAGLGYILWNTPANNLKSELGAGYINEERRSPPDSKFASGRAYSKYEHLFTSTAKFTQDVEYLHNFEQSKDYRLNTETALIAPVSTHVSLKASFAWKRVGRPPTGFIKDDTITSAALIISY